VTPPGGPQSVFAGRGIFTVERPEDANGLKVDDVLRQQIREVWYDDVTLATRWVYQAETPEQYDFAINAEMHLAHAEYALVSNLYMGEGEWPDGWTCMPECYWNADGGKPGVGRSIPNMLFRARQVIGPERWGTIPVVPVVGCYDASGENPGAGVRLTWPDYLADLEAAMRSDPCVVGFAVWRVETLDPADVAALS